MLENNLRKVNKEMLEQQSAEKVGFSILCLTIENLCSQFFWKTKIATKKKEGNYKYAKFILHYRSHRKGAIYNRRDSFT